MKCRSCHPSAISLTVLSATFILLSLISIVSSASIANVPDYDTNSELDSISKSDNNFIPTKSIRQNYQYLKDIVSKRANIHYLRNVLEALDNKLEKFQKRTCYINAGMTHNCDFKDLISAMNARRFWESTHSPGRRKRQMKPSNLLSQSLTSPLPLRSFTQ